VEARVENRGKTPRKTPWRKTLGKMRVKTPVKAVGVRPETLSAVAIKLTVNRERRMAEVSTPEVDVAPQGPMARAVAESGEPGEADPIKPTANRGRWAAANDDGIGEVEAPVLIAPTPAVSGEPGEAEAVVVRMAQAAVVSGEP